MLFEKLSLDTQQVIYLEFFPAFCKLVLCLCSCGGSTLDLEPLIKLESIIKKKKSKYRLFKWKLPQIFYI